MLEIKLVNVEPFLERTTRLNSSQQVRGGMINSHQQLIFKASVIQIKANVYSQHK